ncbi:hypothetical protein EAL2_c08550 [Peptoclostridium acidaminophilum DSM 3953]|uniref:OCT domain-containing protein n=1 Tax=Peptoclostridium acidaminophilum DSM 3953 TaxID=1286171 RepID=W8T5P7_PEPAC|nr:DUF1967 domain-containing protein [Peptoclostridium acidaminophilum]AHM56155.1 hypothetical protein EAL2_c08550 [Peptoclostridium acidaminophilum DSM 3953]
MGSVDLKSEFVIEKFLDRYDYDGVEEILRDSGIEDGDLVAIVSACKYLVSFDFKTSAKRLESIRSNEIKNRPEIKDMKEHLLKLIEGEPVAIFSELIGSLKIQCSKEEYIDYLGRVYRLKEALMKYLFISRNNGNGKRQISMTVHVPTKYEIMNILRRKYRIYTGSLSGGISEYLNMTRGKNKSIKEALAILNAKNMDGLIKLRHECPVGHGFKGVSREDIEAIYGEPSKVVSDFVRACRILDLHVNVDRHDNINNLILEMLDRYAQKREM